MSVSGVARAIQDYTIDEMAALIKKMQAVLGQAPMLNDSKPILSSKLRRYTKSQSASVFPIPGSFVLW